MRTRTRAVLLAATMLLPLAGGARAVEIAMSCGAVGQDMQSCREGVDAWSAKTGNQVRIVSTPQTTTERLALYQQFLAAQSADVDVYMIDVIWPGILGQFFIDLGPALSPSARAAFSPALVANDTIGGKLVAVPWYTDAGVMFYRRDLLEKHGLAAPTTWAEMDTAATKIQAGERAAGNEKFWGFVFQGRAYEGLTCDALEWVDSFGGGTIVAADGKVTIDNPATVAALKTARSWVGRIAPAGVVSYTEEDARGAFQAGNAAFMRNWPYAWSLAQGADSPVKGKVGVAALPQGPGADARRTGTLGGWQLAVSRFSRHPKEATDLVIHLAGREEQKRRAVRYAYNPSITDLYADADVLAAAPLLGDLRATFDNAVARPSAVAGPRYNEVSAAFWTAVHASLTGEQEPEAAVKALGLELRRLSRGGRWR